MDLWGSICCYPVKLWNRQSNCHWFVMPWYSCRVPVMTVNFVWCLPGNAAEKKTVWLVLPFAMALMWRHCNGNAVYNLSHETRDYLPNMIMLPMRECRCLFQLARKYSWTNIRSGGDFRPSFVVILLTKLRWGGFIRPKVKYRNWFLLE